MAYRVVVLTSGNAYGRLILNAIAGRGFPPAAVVVYQPPLFRRRTGQSPAGWTAGLPRVALRWARGRVRRRFEAAYRIPGARLVFGGELNGARLSGRIRALEPDVLVLAGCHILESPLLQVPRIGVLNVHPGLLPWVRGGNPMPHALLRGVAVGSSAYWVDPGIDTGRVISRRLLAPTGRETTLREIEEANARLSAEMTADLVALLARGELPPPGAPQQARFPLCGGLPPEARARVDALVRGGRALALFERWRLLCTADGLTLPDDLDTGRAALEPAE